MPVVERPAQGGSISCRRETEGRIPERVEGPWGPDQHNHDNTHAHDGYGSHFTGACDVQQKRNQASA